MSQMPEMREGDWVCPACSNHNYADKVLCNRCNVPKALIMGAKDFRQGDWMCPACGNHNYSSKMSCNRCQKPKAMLGVMGTPTAAQAHSQNMRRGDWICPSCSNHNYASKTACNRCSLPKAENAKVTQATTPRNFRQGDWMCADCGNHNYASKMTCNRCQSPKPAVEVGEEYGPATKLGSTRPSPYGLASAPGGSWTCRSCSNVNWPMRTACNRCQLPRQEAEAPDLQPGNSMNGMQAGAHVPLNVPPSQAMGWGAAQNIFAASMAGAMPMGMPMPPPPPMQMGVPMTAMPYNTGPTVVVRPSLSPPTLSSMAGAAPPPPPPAKEEPGWFCPVCSNHNDADKSHCTRCGIPKETRISDFGLREGDWICLVCANHNFASKSACNKCGASKENAPMIHQVVPGVSQNQIRGKNEMRDGDWICAYCRNHNYSRRTECNRCKQIRT